MAKRKNRNAQAPRPAGTPASSAATENPIGTPIEGAGGPATPGQPAETIRPAAGGTGAEGGAAQSLPGDSGAGDGGVAMAGLNDEQGRQNESGLASGTASGAGAEVDGATAGDTGHNDGDGSADGQNEDASGNAGSAPGSSDGTAAPHTDESATGIEPAAVDYVVAAAETASFFAVEHLTEFFEIDPDEIDRVNSLAGLPHSASTNAMAELLRKIGRDRATPQVLLQQLVLLKHRHTAEATRAETLVVRIFSSIVAELDEFEREFRAEQEARSRHIEQQPPTPLEDTILEGIGDSFDTY